MLYSGYLIGRHFLTAENPSVAMEIIQIKERTDMTFHPRLYRTGKP